MTRNDAASDARAATMFTDRSHEEPYTDITGQLTLSDHALQAV